MNHYPIYVVEWGDAFIDTSDFDQNDADSTEPVYRKSVGFLIAKNQHGYVLATDEYNDKEEGVAAKLFIPHGMVVKATKYSPSRRQPKGAAQESRPSTEPQPPQSI